MSDEDDLLNPDEIEALLGGGDEEVDMSAPAPSAPSAPAPTIPPPTAATAAPPAGSDTEQLLNQAEADLAAAIAPNLDSDSVRSDVEGAADFAFSSLGNSKIDPKRRRELESLQDVELDLRIELGRTELLIEDVVSLKAGSVVPLDKLAGDPVDIVVNGRLVARGEVLVLNDNFCIRVAEILSPDF